MAMTMNASFSKMPWRQQLGVLGALSVGAVVAFWYFYAAPAKTRIEAQVAELAAMQAEIDRTLDTARRLPEFRKQVAQLEIEDARLRAVLPEEQDVADLLRRVQGMATQSNLTITGFVPQAVARREIHAEWPIGLRLEGTYHDLGAFLERVSRFPRIINVGGIKLSTKPNEAGVATISAECTATTFVLMEQAPAAAPPGGAKPAGQAATVTATASGVAS